MIRTLVISVALFLTGCATLLDDGHTRQWGHDESVRTNIPSGGPLTNEQICELMRCPTWDWMEWNGEPTTQEQIDAAEAEWQEYLRARERRENRPRSERLIVCPGDERCPQ